MDPVAARRLLEQASVRQDVLDMRAIVDDIGNESGGGMPPLGGPGGLRAPVDQANGRGRGRRFVIPRNPGETDGNHPRGAEDSEKNPRKKRKGAEKGRTSDIFPEAEWPVGYTREQVDQLETSEVIKIQERQHKQKKMAGKELPLPGELQFDLLVDS